MIPSSSFYTDITVHRAMKDEFRKAICNTNDDDDDDCCTIVTVPSEETEDENDQQEEQKPIRKKLVRFGSVRVHHHSLIASSTLPVLEVTLKNQQNVHYGDHDNDDDDISTLDEHQKRVAATYQHRNMIGPFLSLEWKPMQTIRIPTVQQYDTIRTGHRRPSNMLRISKMNKEQIVQSSNDAIQYNNNNNMQTTHQQQQSYDKQRREDLFEEKLALRDAATVIIKKCKSTVQQESAIKFLCNHGFTKTANAVQNENKRHLYDISIDSISDCRKRSPTSCCTNEPSNYSIEIVSTTPSAITIPTQPPQPPTKLLTLNDLHAWDRSEFGVSSNVSFALATAKKSKVKSSTTTRTIPLIFCVIEENYCNNYIQQQQPYNHKQQVSTGKHNYSMKTDFCNNSDNDTRKKKSSKSLLEKITNKSKKLIAKHILLTAGTVQVAPAPITKTVSV